MGNLLQKSKKHEQFLNEKYEKHEEEEAKVPFLPQPGPSAPIDIQQNSNNNTKFAFLKESFSSISEDSSASRATDSSIISEPYKCSPKSYFIQWRFDESLPNSTSPKKKYRLTHQRQRKVKKPDPKPEENLDPMPEFPLIDSYSTYTVTPTTTKIVDKLITSL